MSCPSLCELCVRRGYNECAAVATTTPLVLSPPATQPPEFSDAFKAGISPMSVWPFKTGDEAQPAPAGEPTCVGCGIPPGFKHRPNCSRMRYPMLKVTKEDTQPQEVGDLSGVTVCCGQYDTCNRPCTPRGMWMATQNQLTEQPATQPVNKHHSTQFEAATRNLLKALQRVISWVDDYCETEDTPESLAIFKQAEDAVQQADGLLHPVELSDAFKAGISPMSAWPLKTGEAGNASPAPAEDSTIQQRDELLVVLKAYVAVIASGGGGDKDLFMAAIREVDTLAREVIQKHDLITALPKEDA